MIDTQLTRRFGLTLPILGAPKPWVADGRLASEICKAGALGILGAGPCDKDWIKTQFLTAGGISVACGLDCDRLRTEPEMLEFVLSFQPRAIYLYGGDPRPFAKTIHRSCSRLICEARAVAERDAILEAGAEVIVIRGAGEDSSNATNTSFALVPELSDYLYTKDDEIILVASGSVTDARGLAAMLTLGADGVCMGRRFWATPECALQGDALIQALGAQAHLADMVQFVQPLLWTIGSRAERILASMPRKIVKEPPGPGTSGVLNLDLTIGNRTSKQALKGVTNGK